MKGCSTCGKAKSVNTRSSRNGTTKPSGGQGKQKVMVVAHPSASFSNGIRRSTHTMRTPISHAQSGRSRRH